MSSWGCMGSGLICMRDLECTSVTAMRGIHYVLLEVWAVAPVDKLFPQFSVWLGTTWCTSGKAFLPSQISRLPWLGRLEEIPDLLLRTRGAYAFGRHSSSGSSRLLSFIPGPLLFYPWWLRLTSTKWSKFHRFPANGAEFYIFFRTVPRTGPCQYSRGNCCYRRTRLVLALCPIHS